MNELKLAEDIFDQLALNKFCTIRLGRRDIALDELLFTSTETDRKKTVKVRKVIYCKAAHVPLVYLYNDGFQDPLDMVDQMKRFYPKITLDSEVTVIDFR